MMKLKHCIIALLLIAAVNMLPITVHAQSDGDFGMGDPDAPADTGVPFDGGISILVAAGVAYGLKKRYDHKNSEKE